MGTPDDPRVAKAKKQREEETDWTPKYNGAPGQEHWVIRQNHKTGERSLDRLWWGLDSVLEQGAGSQADQCQGRDGCRTADVP